MQYEMMEKHDVVTSIVHKQKMDYDSTSHRVSNWFWYSASLYFLLIIATICCLSNLALLEIHQPDYVALWSLVSCLLVRLPHT